MKTIDRRTFLAGSAAAGLIASLESSPAHAAGTAVAARPEESFNTVVDFRYAPHDFPRDLSAAINQFGTIVEFTLGGLEQDVWLEQKLEAPGLPIVHTRLERPTATIELTAFASNRAGEGRVDNVVMEIRARAEDVTAAPLVRIRSAKGYRLQPKEVLETTILREGDEKPWLVCIPQENQAGEIFWKPEEGGYQLSLELHVATSNHAARYLFRMPQAGAGEIDTKVAPEVLLTEVRNWWAGWKEFGKEVRWEVPGVPGEFLTACARNIQQAREVEDGRLVFKVGPTVYRGLWIVDGNFLLEAARYLGYDEAADEGLRAEWKQQVASGQVIAAGGKEHWKDTAIAIFTLVRACELKQDWVLLRQLAPNVGQAIDFLIGLRDAARHGDSPNGRYGLLAPGFPDGGVGGICYEFTNTLWTLAGLKAAALANEKLKLPELVRAAGFYRELRHAFDAAAKEQMVDDPRGFRYLPMLMREDPAMRLSEWTRPRPQSSQWALSQTIVPGLVFRTDDPVVRGHIALMQACTREDIPAETGWLHHQAVWNYNAAFVAEVYLWAGMREWAHRTFTGYLNHASPLYAWREEQPLLHALMGDSWGDMPHNWASAECVRYLRHMLVLEDGQSLRLLDGLMPADLKHRKPFVLEGTPTRFGRVSLSAEPCGQRGWKLHFTRQQSECVPESVAIRAKLDEGAVLARVAGAEKRRLPGGRFAIDPAAREWTAWWE